MASKEDFEKAYSNKPKDLKADFEAMYDQKAGASVPAVTPVRNNPRKSDWKPKADYGTPFHNATGGALIHAGKILREGASGLKQVMPFVDSEEYAQETQDMANQYDKYDHPFLGKAAGEALNIAPFLAGGPKAVGNIGKFLGSKNLQSLSTQMGAKESRNMFPGLAGGAIGAAGAGAYHVDPNLSKADQWKQRLKMAAFGGGIGAGADILGAVGANRSLKKEGIKEQVRQSGPLDVTVRTPPSKLFPGQSINVDRLERLAKEAPLLGGDMATGRAKDVIARPKLDLSENANIIKEQTTGSSTLPYKGDAMEEPLKFVRESNELMKGMRDKLNKDAIFSADTVVVPDGKYASDLRTTIAENNQVSGMDKFISGEFKGKYNSIINSVDKVKTPTTSGVGPVKPTSMNITNYGNMLKAERDLKNLAKASFSTSHSAIAADAAREVRKTLDEIAENKAYTSSNPDAITKLQSADTFRNNYNDLFMSDPTIRKAVSEKDGGITAQQFSDSLLQSSNTSGIDKLMQIMPESKGPMRQEMLGKFFKDSPDGPNQLNLDKFIQSYGDQQRRPVVSALFDEQTVSKLDKMRDLSMLNTSDRGNTRFAPDTGAWKEMAVGVKPNALETGANIPLLGNFGPQQLSDIFFTGQQRGVKRHPLGATRAAGVIGDVMATQHEEDISDIAKFIKKRMGQSYNLLTDEEFRKNWKPGD